MAIEKLTDFVKVANDKWTYGESKFGYESEVNQDHNIIYPFLLIKPPTTNIENVYNGWQDHDFEVQFYNTFEKEARDAVELQKRWDNLEDLGLEWMDMILKNYNNTEVIISHDSVVIEREKEDKNDKLVKINMIFQVRMFRRCFNPQYKYPTDVNGLVSWLKADSDVTFNIHKKTSSQWLDQTSNNNDVSQLTELSKPLRYGFDGASDKSKITFNGKSQYFESNNNMPITGNDFSIFHVAKCEQLPTTLSQSIISYKDTYGDEEIRNGNFTEIGAENILNGDFSEIGTEEVLNGDFSDIGPENVLNGDFSEEGAEEVTNGGFATDSNWNKNSNWTISGGVAIADGSSNNDMNQSLTIVVGTIYKVTYTVVSLNSGSFNFSLGGVVGNTITSIGTYSEEVTAVSTDRLRMRGILPNGSIDNVSVKEVGQDWSFGTGWSIVDDKASSVTSGGSSYLTQAILTASKSYKITFTVSNYVSGTLKVIVSGQEGSSITANGTYTEILNTTGVSFGFKSQSGAFIGSIDNVSVKEVGQDWNIYNGWSVGNNKVIFSDTANGDIRTASSIFTANKNYQIKLTVADLTGANTAFFGMGDGGPSNLVNYTHYSNGEHIFNVTAPNGSHLRIYSTTSSGGSYSITNISVKEVGQDWTFNSNWTISNNLATSDGSQTGNVSLKQSQSLNNLTQGAFYKVTYTISNYQNGSINPHIRGIATGSVTGNGIKTSFGIAGNAYDGINLYANSTFEGSVDNVSVKQVGKYWTFGGGWGISGDSAIHNGATSANISQNIPLIIGTSYIVTYTVVDASAGSQVGIAPSGTTIQTIRTTNGTYTEIFTAEAVSLYIRSLWNNDNPVSLQNISIRESKSDKLNIGVEPSGRIQFKVLDDNGNEAIIISDSSELATSNHIISSRVHNHKLHLQYNNNTEIEGNFPQYSNADGFNITTFRIGSILDGLAENHFNGDIQEIIIYNKYLDDYERDMVKNYLNNKYNIY